MPDILVAFVVPAVGLAAAITDVHSRRIPNVLTFGAALAGLIVHAFVAGWSGLGTAALGWLVGTLMFLPLYLLRGMGAGDVKLLAALGAWIGPADVIWLALYASLAGGVMALAVAVTHGYTRTAVRNVFNLVSFWWLAGLRPMPALTLERSTGPRLAYAIPIFAGTLVTIWLR